MRLAKSRTPPASSSPSRASPTAEDDGDDRRRVLQCSDGRHGRDDDVDVEADKLALRPSIFSASCTVSDGLSLVPTPPDVAARVARTCASFDMSVLRSTRLMSGC